jgi:FtsH-binding integral membrane protein
MTDAYGSLAMQPVATRDDTTRADFIVRVYQHLMAAIVAFVAIETLLIMTGVAEKIYDFLSGGSWLLILGLFMVIQWMATSAAHDILNPQRQYLGLFGMAFGEALIFAPFLHYVFEIADDGATSVGVAAVITALGFAGLSAVAFTTRTDLSFMRPLLIWGGVAAMLLIVAAILFGFALGVWFSVAMIAFAGGAILYQTQTIMRRYPAEAYVGAAVQLFASVMLLFWYVLRLVVAMRD